LIERAPIAIRGAAVPPAKAVKAKAKAEAALPNAVEEADLFAELRALRKTIADERNVPAYVVFSDAVLRTMAREAPATLGQLRAISGVGDKKLADFGERFLAAIVAVRGEPASGEPAS
jgi:ATP-dependent DNA helicase RecQ